MEDVWEILFIDSRRIFSIDMYQWLTKKTFNINGVYPIRYICTIHQERLPLDHLCKYHYIILSPMYISAPESHGCWRHSEADIRSDGSTRRSRLDLIRWGHDGSWWHCDDHHMEIRWSSYDILMLVAMTRVRLLQFWVWSSCLINSFADHFMTM